MVPEEFARRMAATFGPDGSAWLEELPGLLAWAADRWGLRVGAPFALSYNYVAAATRADGAAVVLKLGVPREEIDTEIAALRLYDGAGAARLLEADAERGALLLERLEPGTMLSSLEATDDEAATAAAAAVMRQIWHRPPEGHGFPLVEQWAGGLGELREQFGGTTGPFPRGLVERAEGLFAELLPSQGERVVLHGDLHHYNILAAERAPWLAIDPKGVLGERAYEVGALLRNPTPQISRRPELRRVLGRRLDQLCEALELDRERTLGWALAQVVLAAWWSYDEGDRGEGWRVWLPVAEALMGL